MHYLPVHCSTWVYAFAEPARLSIVCSTESRERPGIFPRVSDVRIERMVERVELCMPRIVKEQYSDCCLESV